MVRGGCGSPGYAAPTRAMARVRALGSYVSLAEIQVMLVRGPSRRVSYSPLPRLAGGVEPEERAAG